MTHLICYVTVTTIQPAVKRICIELSTLKFRNPLGPLVLGLLLIFEMTAHFFLALVWQEYLVKC